MSPEPTRFRVSNLLKPAFLASLCFLVATGCVSSSKTKLAKDKERLKAYILAAAPEDVGVPLNLDYDGKIRLLGARIEPRGPVKPGQRIKLTLYWSSEKKLEGRWGLFTHVLDGSGERILNIDNVGPLREWRESRQALPPSAWEPGKVYLDEQVFDLPTTLQTETLRVVTGIWRDNERLPIRSGPHDADQRGIVATLTTEVGPTATPQSTRVPLLQVPILRTDLRVQIDGKLDEPAWTGAADTGPFVDAGRGSVNSSLPIQGRAKLLWNEQGFYLGFSVRDPEVVGGFKTSEKDPHLWTRDTVEIMVDPDGDGDNKDYFEIQINPQNLVFDSHFDDYNQPKVEPNGPFGHQTWSAELKSAVSIEGTLDLPGDKDVGYVVEAFVPWKSFAKAGKVPPPFGTTWRMNFYAMENNRGVAWSPILGQGNFHKASRFGRVIWQGTASDAAPAASAPLPVPRSELSSKLHMLHGGNSARPMLQPLQLPNSAAGAKKD